MTEKTYQKKLEKHLTDYKVHRLGIEEEGTFVFQGTSRKYGHILPKPLAWLNIPEPFRREVREYVATRPAITTHKFFHHLNSSQAFAFALFHPYLNQAPRVLARALGVSDIADWDFERVPEPEEGTNVDVWWTTKSDAATYCEVKLSEREFGAASTDERHLRKLERTYAPILRGVVDDALLAPKAFFANYQILRNLWLAARGGHSKDTVLFLIPAANVRATQHLNDVLAQTRDSLRVRVRLVHVEALLDTLAAERSTDGMGWYAQLLREKYVLTSS
jgi:hypothetical protein